MKKAVRLALLFALSVVAGSAFAQTTTPNVGLNAVAGDVSYSQNMAALDKILVGGRASLVTTAVPIVTTSLSSTTLAFPSVPANGLYHGHCNIVWQQNTGVATIQFGLSQTVVPTNLWALSVLSFGTAGGTTQVNYGTQNLVAATQVSGAAVAPGAIATGYRESLDIVVQNGAAGADVITIQGLTSNAADALQIDPGSYCNWSL